MFLHILICFKNCRSLWYIAHGFTLPAQPKGKCFLKYNSKGYQTKSKISPITLEQLVVPFVILICGYLLAIFQLLRELMHAHFRRQMIIEQEIDPPVAIAAPPSDPDINSHPISATATPSSIPPVDTVVPAIISESPLIITDIEMESEADLIEIPTAALSTEILETPIDSKNAPPVTTAAPPDSPPSDVSSHPVAAPPSTIPPIESKTTPTEITAAPSVDSSSSIAVIDIEMEPETVSVKKKMKPEFESPPTDDSDSSSDSEMDLILTEALKHEIFLTVAEIHHHPETVTKSATIEVKETNSVTTKKVLASESVLTVTDISIKEPEVAATSRLTSSSKIDK